VEEFALSGCCATFAGKWLPTFRGKIRFYAVLSLCRPALLLLIVFEYWIAPCSLYYVASRYTFSLCVVSRYFSMSHRSFTFATGPFAFASLPFYSAAYFRSVLDASRRFSLPEILKQSGTL
jgi:hypothetical protein